MRTKSCKYQIIILLALMAGSSCLAQGLRTVSNQAFQTGEVLKFKLYYDAWLTGKVVAGYGMTEVKESPIDFYGRKAWHLDAEGNSTGLFDFFFKVRDRFDSYIDKEALIPHMFVRRTREGGYKKDDDYNFNQYQQRVITRKDTFNIPPFTHDIISAFYYARTLDLTGLQVGDEVPLSFFLDDSTYNSVIIYEGKENVKTGLGTFRCMRFRPMVATGEVFSNPYPMTLWVTDDLNRLPILAKSAVIVGNVKMELTEYKGLANPVTSRVE
jgi:hypothetical protein